MSGLLHGLRRWPSWMSACVSGANLVGVLEAHDFQRLRLKLPDLQSLCGRPEGRNRFSAPFAPPTATRGALTAQLGDADRAAGTWRAGAPVKRRHNRART